MKIDRRPSREEFIAYWKGYDTFSWPQLLPYVLYIGCMTIYAIVMRRIDPEGRFWLPSLIVALSYVIVVPYFEIRRVHKKFARLIRCPSCGDWFGQDASGAYSGPDPKFRSIIETGRCTRCGEPILSDHGDAT